MFKALEHNAEVAGAIIMPTTQYGFLQLYNQLLPDQGIGTFESLEAATETRRRGREEAVVAHGDANERKMSGEDRQRHAAMRERQKEATRELLQARASRRLTNARGSRTAMRQYMEDQEQEMKHQIAALMDGGVKVNGLLDEAESGFEILAAKGVFGLLAELVGGASFARFTACLRSR